MSIHFHLFLTGAFWFHLCVAAMLIRKPPTAKTKSIRNLSDGIPLREKQENNAEITLSPQKLMIENESGLVNHPPNNSTKCLEFKESTNDSWRTDSDAQGEEIFYVALEQNPSNVDVMNDGIKNTSHPEATSAISTTAEEQITVDLPKKENILTIPNKISSNGRAEVIAMLTNILFLRHLLMTCLGTAAAFGILYLLPALAKEWGADEFVSSLTVTITGASEILTR